MNQRKRNLVWSAGVPITLLLATSGCATKKYVVQQVTPVSQRVDTLQAQTDQKFTATNDKIDANLAKEEKDISQVNERIASTDTKLNQTASATQQAQSTASSAAQQADANSAQIANTSKAVGTLSSGVANALNYQLVQKADVTFDFDKSTLSPEATAALDDVASKVQSMPRAIVELVGFTDTVGDKDYNLMLSRQRAEAVQRYLVMQKVPLRAITLVGLGEEAPPPGLEADVSALDPNASKADLARVARRVRIQVFGAGTIVQVQTSGGAAQQ